MVVTIRGVDVVDFGTAVQVVNSYKITDDEEKNKILDEMLDKFPRLARCRTKRSLLIEWKAHNILFQRNYHRARTKDVDFEFCPKKLQQFGFHLITMLLREKQR